MVDALKLAPTIKKYKLLEKRFGGTWKYHGVGHWHCEDGRIAAYVSNGVDEFDDPYPGPYRICVYGGDKTECFYWHEIAEGRDNG